jgi:photosystem II stability/assembly factor-like uncharacterized protein
MRYIHAAYLIIVLSVGRLLAAQAPQSATGPTITLNPGEEISFKLVTPTSGWVLVHDGSNGQNHLLWTNDDGAHWREITPPLAANQMPLAVFFLNDSQGWAVLATSGYPAEVTTAFTTDQGKTWTKEPFTAASEDLLKDFGGNAAITFADASHGWIALERMGHESIGDLFSTVDGGQTWTELPKPPIYGPAGFTSALHGWLVARSLGRLYITQDGGQSWISAKPLVRPNAVSGSHQTYYSAPAFSDDQRGVMAATYVLGRTSVFATYESSDGGLTWQITAFSPHMPPTVPSSGFDSKIVAAFRGGTHIMTNLRTPSSGRLQQSIAALSSNLPILGAIPSVGSVISPAEVSDISFADEQHGWYVYSWSQCSGRKLRGGPKVTCTKEVKLLSTPDGGTTLTDATPPVPAPPNQSMAWPQTAPQHAQTGSSQRGVSPFFITGSGTEKLIDEPGFDTTNYMDAVSAMQAWWLYSPYWAIGFYLAGAETTEAGGWFTPDSNWIFDTACEGWDYMPIWDGLQAPCCTGCSQHMSWDASQAAAQGADAANRAANALADLGLYGGIAYVDIEYYNPDGGACSEAVQAFLANWVLYMHSHGYHAGAYGSAADVATDFFNGQTVQNPPDDVWIAKWDNKSTEIYGLSPVPDQVWVGDQRIHQYDHDITEGYSGWNLTIDQDYIDADVAFANTDSCPCDICDPSCVNYDPSSC